MRRVLYANFTSPASTPLLIDNFKKKRPEPGVLEGGMLTITVVGVGNTKRLATPKTKRLEF